MAESQGSGTVLVVEDDVHITDLLRMYLQQGGFGVLVAREGAAALELIERDSPRLIIVDIGLPGGMDGLEVCRHIRRVGAIPVIILTARDEEIDRILGLELGADDYVTKPFSPRELVARVKAVLRRADGPPPAAAPSLPTLAFGELEIDRGRREVRAEGRPIALTTREFDLLAFLALNGGLALSRQQLLDGVWGTGWYGDERTVDVHVWQLRRKLGHSLPLDTVWGVGYRLG